MFPFAGKLCSIWFLLYIIIIMYFLLSRLTFFAEAWFHWCSVTLNKNHNNLGLRTGAAALLLCCSAQVSCLCHVGGIVDRGGGGRWGRWGRELENKQLKSIFVFPVSSGTSGSAVWGVWADELKMFMHFYTTTVRRFTIETGLNEYIKKTQRLSFFRLV